MNCRHRNRGLHIEYVAAIIHEHRNLDIRLRGESGICKHAAIDGTDIRFTGNHIRNKSAAVELYRDLIRYSRLFNGNISLFHQQSKWFG